MITKKFEELLPIFDQILQQENTGFRDGPPRKGGTITATTTLKAEISKKYLKILLYSLVSTERITVLSKS